MDLATARELAHDLADHRVVTAGALRLAGADGSVIHLARRRGVLQSLDGIEGVYVVGEEPLDDDVRLHVAARWAGPDAVISGIWGARLLSLSWIPDRGPCLVRIDARYKRRTSQGFVSVCRTARLEQIATWDYQGLSVATAPHAVADACRQISADRLVTANARLRAVRGVVLGAIADKRCTAADLERVLGLGSMWHTADIRRALIDAGRGAASPPEAELVDDLLVYGIPFYCNVEVYVDGVLIGVADVYLVGTGVGGELDSKQEHAQDDRLDATLVRHGRFEEAGVDLRHITPSRYRRDPQAFHATLFRAVMARRAKGLGDPPGLELRPRGPLLRGPVSSAAPYTSAA